MTPTRAKFWQYQPVVAPSMEPNESRNPPSAAYAAQECPAKNPGMLEVVDDSGNQRTVSPTGRTQEQTKSLNAACSKGLDAATKWFVAQAVRLRTRSAIELFAAR